MRKRQTLLLFTIAMVVAVALGAFIAMRRSLASRFPSPDNLSAEAMFQVVLCYPDLQHDRLVRQPMVFTGMSKEQVIAEIVARLQSPEMASVDPALPPNAKLLKVRWEGVTVILDFDGGLTDASFWQGSEIAHLRLQALVHSLASLPQVQRVQLTVKGQPLESLGGHEEVSQPLEPDPALR